MHHQPEKGILDRDKAFALIGFHKKIKKVSVKGRSNKVKYRNFISAPAIRIPLAKKQVKTIYQEIKTKASPQPHLHDEFSTSENEDGEEEVTIHLMN